MASELNSKDIPTNLRRVCINRNKLAEPSTSRVEIDFLNIMVGPEKYWSYFTFSAFKNL